MDNPIQGPPTKATHAAAVVLVVGACLFWLAASVFVTDLVSDQPTSTNPIMLAHRFNEYTLANIKFKQVFGVLGIVTLLGCITGLFHLYTNQRSLHGAARFATTKEITKGGLFTKTGLIVGKHNGKYLVFGGQEFVLLAAPTRSGKGVSVVIPNLLNWQESMVVVDVKLENYAMTSGWRQKVLHQDVYLFNPFDTKGKTHRWNPLDNIRRDPVAMMADVQQIAHIFYPSNDGDKNRFFADSAQNLFNGLVLYLIETNHPNQTLGEVLRQASGYGRPIIEHIQTLIDACPDKQCRDPLSRFLAVSSPETVGNIKATFDAALQLFAQPAMDWATSASDFNLGDIRRKRMTVYFGIPVDMIAMASRLQTLFFTQVINLNTRVLPEDDLTLQYQALLCLDEFAAMGRVAAIEKGVAYIAGYGLRLLTILQSRAQIADPRLYGRDSAQNIIANHGVKIVYTPSTDEDAKQCSEMLGSYTAKATSVSSNRTSTNPLSVNNNRSSGSSTSDQRRMLMLPQELKQMANDACVIDRQGIPPIMAKKAFYYDDVVFLKRLAQVSPALAELLAKGQNSVSKEEITKIRVLGEFEASLATAPFAPVFSSPPPSTSIEDDDLVVFLDDSVTEIAPNSLTETPPLSHTDSSMVLTTPSATAASAPSQLLALLGNAGATTAQPLADETAISDAEIEIRAQALAARLMDYSAAPSVADWLESVRTEFRSLTTRSSS